MIARGIADGIGFRKRFADVPSVLDQATVDLEEKDETTNQDKDRKKRQLMLAQSADLAEFVAVHQPHSRTSGGGGGRRRSRCGGGASAGECGGELFDSIKDGTRPLPGLLQSALGPDRKVDAEQEYADPGAGITDGEQERGDPPMTRNLPGETQQIQIPMPGSAPDSAAIRTLGWPVMSSGGNHRLNALAKSRVLLHGEHDRTQQAISQ